MPDHNHLGASRTRHRPAMLLCLLTSLGLGAWTVAAQSPLAAKGAKARSAPASTVNQPLTPKPLLPPSFAGQPRSGDVVVAPTPAAADSAHAAVLKEDGMVEASQARYGSGAANGWTLKAIRFGDVTGAYAAFTYFRTPHMQPEPVGDDAAAGDGMFLVRRGATLVLAQANAHSSVSDNSVIAAMRVLVKSLPKIYGPEAIAPIVPTLLPREGLQARTVRYSLGPAGYTGPLPSGILGFQADAEVASAEYHLRNGKEATLTLSMLPTPQLAAELMKDAAAMPDAAVQIASRQYSSLIGIVTGRDISKTDAAALLDKVHYAPQITIAEPVSAGGTPNPVAQVAGLLVTVAEFTILMAVSAVLLAGFFGFGRVYIRRLRGKPDSSLYDEEFITLKLK